MTKFTCLLLTFAAVLSLAAGDYAIKDFTLDHKDGFYRCGETLTLTGQLTKAGKPVTDGKLRLLLKWEERNVSTIELPCDGKPFRITYNSRRPGWVYFGFEVVEADGKTVEVPGPRLRHNKKRLLAEIGAIFGKDQLKIVSPMPKDFREFWQKQLAEIDKVPCKAKVERLDAREPGIELYAVTIDTPANRPATGYLAIPVGAKPKSCPAFLTIQSWSQSDAARHMAVNRARRGGIGMAVTWHGNPVAQPKEFYRGRCGIGVHAHLDDPTKWPWIDAYRRSLRAAQYLKTRPEWDGKTFVVQGGSLGGALAIAVAALIPGVTTAVLDVPGHCEFDAEVAGRCRAGYTWLTDKVWSPRTRDTVSYYDFAHFAALLHCEVYMATGFVDEGCPPSNIIAAFNNIPAGTKKNIYTNPRTGHGGETWNSPGYNRIEELLDPVDPAKKAKTGK